MAIHWTQEQKDIVKLLLEYGSDVNLTCVTGQDILYPLHLALKSEDYDVLNMLLQYGSRLDSRTTDNSTFLNYAVKNCSVKSLQFLLDNNEDINVTGTSNNITPLQQAIQEKKESMIDALLRHVIKLKTLNRLISEANLKCLMESINADMEGFMINCQMEVCKLFSTTLHPSSHVTLYHLLTKKTIHLLDLLEDKAIEKSLMENDFEEFPIFSSMLKQGIRRCINECEVRRAFHTFANRLYSSSMLSKLTLDCYQSFWNYFSYADMVAMVKKLRDGRLNITTDL